MNKINNLIEIKTWKNNSIEKAIANLEELVRLSKAEYDRQHTGLRGFRTLWSESLFSNTAKERILNNYKAVSKEYPNITKLLTGKELAHTGLRDKLDNITSSLHYELKKSGASQAELNILAPFLKTKKELVVEEKYRNELIFKYKMPISDLELEIKNIYELLEKAQKQSEEVSKTNYYNSKYKVFIGFKENVQKAEEKVKFWEKELATKQASLASLYQGKSEFINQKQQQAQIKQTTNIYKIK